MSKCAHKIRWVKILQNTLLEDQCVTHPPESTGATTRTKGGSKGKLSCKLETEKIVLKTLSPSAPPLKIISQYIHKTESYLLYKRNWAECSPPLPFLLRPVSHYVADYLGLPCNKQQMNTQIRLKNTAQYIARLTISVRTYVLNLTCHS